jgi:hypothetical protein
MNISYSLYIHSDVKCLQVFSWSIFRALQYLMHCSTIQIKIAAKYRQLMKQLIYLNLPYGRIMAYFSFLADKISITTSLENVDSGLEPSQERATPLSVLSLVLCRSCKTTMPVVSVRYATSHMATVRLLTAEVRAQYQESSCGI